MKDSGDDDLRPVIEWLGYLAIMGSIYFIGLTEVVMAKKLSVQMWDKYIWMTSRSVILMLDLSLHPPLKFEGVELHCVPLGGG